MRSAASHLGANRETRPASGAQHILSGTRRNTRARTAYNVWKQTHEAPCASESLWCCTEHGSRPPEAGLQEQASNRPVLLRSKGVVVSDRAKVIPEGWQVSVEKMSESKPSDDASSCPQALSKLRWTIGFRTNRDATCLRTRWQPVYRRHELNTGFGTERESLDLDEKGNDKWQKPRGRIPMSERGSGLLIIVMKLLQWEWSEGAALPG